MALPKTLSSQKKKKKLTYKKLLCLPAKAIYRAPEIGVKEIKEWEPLLRKYFSGARLPKKVSGCDVTNTEVNPNELSHAKAKRSQLSIGINAVCRDLRKGRLAAAFFDGEIKPAHVIYHLQLLCQQEDVPLLGFPNLREVTRNTLGFSCISIGLRMNCEELGEMIKKVRTVCKITTNAVISEPSKKDIKGTEREKLNVIEETGNKEREGSKFEFLYRNTVNERAFYPETTGIKGIHTNASPQFIKLPDVSSSIFVGVNKTVKRIFNEAGKDSSKTFPNDEEEVQKKKVKDSWVVDNFGRERQVSYGKTNIMKVRSNPNRKKPIKTKAKHKIK